MENTPPQQPSAPQQQAPRPRRLKRFVLIAAGILLIALIAFAVRNLWEPDQEVPLERPLDLPVEEPEVESMDEVAAIMDGKPVPPELPDMKLPPFDEDDHIYGERFAEFSIVEYSNYGNRYASLLHPELKAYVDASNGSVNWVVRHYPVSSADYRPAQAAECAYFEGGHPAFWAYFDQSFTMSNLGQQLYIDLAASQELDTTSFTTCLEKDFTRDHVLIDLQDGRLDAKVRVSPSYIVVNNLTGKMRLVEGVNTIGYLDEVVEVLR